jgi:hypothetical protein
MGKPDDKRPRFPTGSLRPSGSAPPAVETWQGAHPRVYKDGKWVTLDPSPVSTQDTGVDKPVTAQAAVSPVQDFLSNCAAQAATNAPMKYDDSKEQRRFNGVLATALQMKSLKSVLESPHPTARSFAYTLRENAWHHASTTETNPRNVPGHYIFMLDQTPTGLYTLKPEVGKAIYDFAFQYFRAHWQAVQPERTPQSRGRS